MVTFNPQERKLIIILCSVITLGSAGQFVFKQYPGIYDIVNGIESERFYPRININSATSQELETIPYIGQYTARTIVEQRRKRGRFKSLEELKSVPGVRQGNYEIFHKYLRVGP